MKNKNQKNLNSLVHNINTKNIIAKSAQKSLKGGKSDPPPIFN